MPRYTSRYVFAGGRQYKSTLHDTELHYHTSSACCQNAILPFKEAISPPHPPPTWAYSLPDRASKSGTCPCKRAQVAQAHLLCQAGRELLERAGLVPVGPYIQSSGGSLSPLPADAGSSGGAGAGARLQAPGVPVLLGGDLNSLPAKWVSDAFDTGAPLVATLFGAW